MPRSGGRSSRNSGSRPNEAGTVLSSPADYFFTAQEFDPETSFNFCAPLSRLDYVDGAGPVLNKYLPMRVGLLTGLLPSLANEWQASLNLLGMGGILEDVRAHHHSATVAPIFIDRRAPFPCNKLVAERSFRPLAGPAIPRHRQQLVCGLWRRLLAKVEVAIGLPATTVAVCTNSASRLNPAGHRLIAAKWTSAPMSIRPSSWQNAAYFESRPSAVR